VKNNWNNSTVFAVSLLVSVFFWGATPATQAAPAASETARMTELSEDNDHLYDEIWSLIGNHFLYRERLQNWTSWRHKYDGTMKTHESANAAINAMLDSLADEYTFYRDESTTVEKRVLQQQTKVVDHKMLDGQVGYIHIATFNSVNCVPETARALIELKEARGIVLDLRDNWGGSIATTFDVFSLLANSGKFVTMKGTTDNLAYSEEMMLGVDSAISTLDGVRAEKQRLDNVAGQKPIVVLVDENTKSAAEMLAGALRDNGRATIVGARTYGKGIVQRVWEFPNNTSIKISSARYYLPGGAYIHRVGLMPDLFIDTSALQKVKNSGRTLARHSARGFKLSSSRHKLAGLIQAEQTSAGGRLSADSDEVSGTGRDRFLSEARMVLRRKLVSLAKP